MEAKLKYPIFSFAPKGNMIYVFWKEELHKTTNTVLLKKRKNYIVVDASGTKYVEKGAHMTGWKGIYGYFTGMQGRVISIEYEYEDTPEQFPLHKLQELIAERYPKTRWFREECWDSVDDFRQTIFACKSFEELAETMELKPLTLRARMVKWLHPSPFEKKLRIKMLIFWIIYLTVCYLIFEWQRKK